MVLKIIKILAAFLLLMSGGCGPSAGEIADRRAICFDLRHIPANENHKLVIGSTHTDLLPVTDDRLARYAAATTDAERTENTPSHCADDVDLPSDRAVLVHAIQVTDNNGHIARHQPGETKAIVATAWHFPRERRTAEQDKILEDHYKQTAGCTGHNCNSPFYTVPSPVGVLAQTAPPAPSPAAVAACAIPKGVNCNGDVTTDAIPKVTTFTAAHTLTTLTMLHPAIYSKAQCPAISCAAHNTAMNIATKSTGSTQSQRYITQNAHSLYVKPTTKPLNYQALGSNNTLPAGVDPNAPNTLAVQKAAAAIHTWHQATARVPSVDFVNHTTAVTQTTTGQIMNDPKNSGIYYHSIGGSTVLNPGPASTAKSLTDVNLNAGFLQEAPAALNYTGQMVGNSVGLECSFSNSLSDDTADDLVTFTCENFFNRFVSVYVVFEVLQPDGTYAEVEKVDCEEGDGCRLMTPAPGYQTLYFLGILSPLPTILGIPIFEKNKYGQTPSTFDAKVKMPPGATRMSVKMGTMGFNVDAVGKGQGVGAGSLSANERLTVITSGIILTSIVNMAIPSLLLALEAGAFGVEEVVAESVGGLIDFLLDIANTATASSGGAETPAQIGEGVGADLTGILTQPFFFKIAGAIIGDEAAGQVQKLLLAVPVLDIGAAAVIALNIVQDVATLGLTAAEVIAGPSRYTFQINRTHDINVNISKDPRDFEFPASATYYTAMATFAGGDTQYATYYSGSSSTTALSCPVATSACAPVPLNNQIPLCVVQPPATSCAGTAGPLQVTFKDVPAAGTVSIEVKFYNKDGWIAGHGVTQQLNNTVSLVGPTIKGITAQTPPHGTVVMQIVENLVPLGPTTTYAKKQELVYGAGVYSWSTNFISTAPAVSDATVGVLSNLTLAESLPNSPTPAGDTPLGEPPAVSPVGLPWMLGYTWQLTEGSNGLLGECVVGGKDNLSLYTYHVTSLVNPLSYLQTTTPDLLTPNVALQSCGTTDVEAIALPKVLSDDTEVSEQGFFTAYSSDQTYHAKSLKCPLVTDPAAGYFPIKQDVLVNAATIIANDSNFVTRGNIFGLNKDTSTIYSLELGEHPCDADEIKNTATKFGGPGTLAGALSNYNLLLSPVTMTMTSEGTLLVLESPGSNFVRVHAMTPRGSSAAYFKTPKAKNCPGGTPPTLASMLPTADAAGTIPANIPQGDGNGNYYAMQLCVVTGSTYLDIAIEDTGYLYVLSTSPSSNTNQVDLYSPNGAYLTTFKDVDAGRIDVDRWRNLYTLNQHSFLGPFGLEPSVSQWIPNTPCTTVSPQPVRGCPGYVARTKQ